MDQARKSLSSLRKAAMSRSPPPSPGMGVSSGNYSVASSPSPYTSQGFQQESANPMFGADPELARAASPSASSLDSALRRAASPSTSSLDAELRRAASPSSVSGVEDLGSVRSNMQHSPRVANSTTTSSMGANPILSAEMSHLRAPQNPATSPMSLTNSSGYYDPEMNKKVLSPSASMRIFQRPQDIVLVPALYIKQTTWGTPRRRICTSLCMLIFFIIFIYLVVRLVDTLRILDSSPSVSEFKVADLCLETFALTVSGSLLNPSGSGATLNAMRTELWLGNETMPNGTHLIGYVDTPAIFVSPGQSDLAIDIQATIPIEQAPYLRELLQNYIVGNDVVVTAKIPISASFAPDIFIIPITYSTMLEMQFTLPSLNSSNSTTNSTAEKPSLIQEVELLKPKDVVNYLTAKLGLQVWTAMDFEDSILEVTVPPLQFDISLGGMHTLTGATSFIHYGKKLPEFMAPVDLGRVNVSGAVGTPDIPGVHYGLGKFQNKSSLQLTAVIRGPKQNHSEVATYRLENGDFCYMSRLLQGVQLEQTIDLADFLEEDEDLAPGNNNTLSPTAAPTTEPYFNLTVIEIVNVNTQATINNRLSVDLKGLNQLFGLKGWIPSIQVYIETNAVNVTDPDVPLLYLDLPISYFFYPNASYLPNVFFNLQLMSATQLIRIADQFFVNGNDVNVSFHTSATGSIASRLLSAVTLEFSLMELMGETPPEVGEIQRRMLQGEGVSPWANKSIGVDVQSGVRDVTGFLQATGFDTDFFGGCRLIWKQFDLEVHLDNGAGGYYPYRVFWVKTTGYDTNFPGGINAEIGMGDDGWGNILRNLIQNITEYQKVHLLGTARYNNGPAFGDDFYFERTPDAAEAEAQGASSFSFFSLYHGEVLSLTSNNFLAHVYFGLDLGELTIDVKVPKIAIAIGRCREPHFIAVVLDDWAFRTGGDAAFAPLQVELEDATKVLNALTTFANGTAQRICIGGHPTLGDNFLSFFLGSLSFDLVIPGRKEEATPVGVEADLLDLTVTSLASEACIQLQLNLTDPTQNPANDSTSFGWGALELLLSTSHLGLPADFLSISVTEGWYGRIDPYRVTHFAAPGLVTPVNVEVCLVADTDRSPADGQAATRGIVQRFYDGVFFDVVVGGTLKPRLPPGNTDVSVITGNFRAPANSFKSLTSLGATTEAAEINATNWFELLEMEIVAFNGGTFSTKITFETGGVGFNLTLPEIHLSVGKLTTPGDLGSEMKLFDIGTFMPPFGYAEKLPLPIALNISLIPPQDWGDTLQLIDDLLTGVADVAVGSTTKEDATLLSHIIPTISFSLSRKDVVSPPTPGPDILDVSIAAVSGATSASVLADFNLLSRVDYKFIWGTINCKLYDGVPGASNEIGSIFIPGQVLQEQGSGPRGINVTLYGQAKVFAQRLFNGTDLVVGFQGSIGSSPFTSSFKIPLSITESIALGKPDSESEASSSFEIIDAAILGASTPGSSGTLPCLFEKTCQSGLIRGDGQLSYSGITAGVTLVYDLPKFNRIRWNVALNSNVFVKIAANGYVLGQVVLRPIQVFSNETSFSPIVSMLPNLAQLTELRATITAVAEGYDTVFTFGGDENENYLSQILKAIEQELPLVDIPPVDPNAPSLMGELTMRTVTTVRNAAVIDATMPVLWDADTLVVSVGSVFAEVLFGHTKTCGGSGTEFCLNGFQVATATTLAPLIVTPKPTHQPLTLRATLHHEGGVLSNWQKAVDDIVSRFIWSFEMPLQLKVTITPPANNRYKITTPFTLETFVTLPPGAPNSGFIDDIQVDVAGTITKSLGDVKVRAVKVLKNTMDFPLVVSYYQYVINLVDTDGVNSGFCTGTGGLLNKINPCTISLGTLCYPPWNSPTPIGPLIRSGDYAQLKPGTSILLDGQKILEPGKTGNTELILDVTIETAARLVDEMMTKETMCGDITQGIMVVGLQSDPNTCQDAGRLEAALQCTFPIRVTFDLKNYPLSDLDTCGGEMDVPNYLGFTFYPTGLYQFDTVWSSVSQKLNPGGTTVRMVADGRQSFGRSDELPISLLDSFQLSFEFRAESNGCGSMGEALSLNFMAERPARSDVPQVGLDCGFFSCSDRYASKNLIGISQGYASLVVAFYQCNSITWVVNGNIAKPYRGSQSCAGAEIDDGQWGTVTLTYNAHDKRASVAYSRSGSFSRSFDFDLDLRAQLGIHQAYLSMTANTGNGGAGACAIVEYRNIVHSGPRSNGIKTTLEGPLELVRFNEVGTVVFRARDENGRKRGRGGNTWLFKILDANTLAPASHNSSLTPRFTDNDDGTYTLHYQIFQRGRYRVEIACQTGVSPNICNNPNQYVAVTTGLFIRA